MTDSTDYARAMALELAWDAMVRARERAAQARDVDLSECWETYYEFLASRDVDELYRWAQAVFPAETFAEDIRTEGSA